MSTQSLPQNSSFDNQVLLLARAARIAADTWRGQVDTELESQIQATAPREAARIIFLYEELAAAIETELTDDDHAVALADAAKIIETVSRKKEVLTGRPRLREIYKKIAIVLLHTFLKPRFITVQNSLTRMTQSNQETILSLLTSACQKAAEAAGNEREQFLALALALGSESSVERDEIVKFFIGTGPAISANEEIQQWIERINEAIRALTEWRGALLSDNPSHAALDLALEEVEAAGLGGWIESAGSDIDALFQSLIAGDKL